MVRVMVDAMFAALVDVKLNEKYNLRYTRKSNLSLNNVIILNISQLSSLTHMLLC